MNKLTDAHIAYGEPLGTNADLDMIATWAGEELLARLCGINGLVEEIHTWGYIRGLHETDDLKPQFVKLAEELGELAAGMARDDKKLILDAAGDMLVVLVQLGAVYNNRFGLNEDFVFKALNAALEQIRNRQGIVKNGVFIKDEAKFMEGAGHD